MILPVDQALQYCEDHLDCLSASEKEVFVKQGKSRVTTFLATGKTPLRIESQALEELGHTTRFGDDKASLTLSATGWPTTPASSSATASGGLRLPTQEIVRSVGETQTVAQTPASSPPAPSAVHVSPTTTDPPGSNRSLLSEGEARRLIENVTAHLRTELSGNFQLSGRLEDGASEALLVNGHGVKARQKTRITSLRLHLSAQGRSVSVYTGGSAGVAIRPTALVQRLVDKLQIGLRAQPLSLEKTAALLAPEVMCVLLQAIKAQFLAPSSCPPQPFPKAVSVVDDPTLNGGVVFATCDGEGVPTRRTQLVSRGKPVHWLRPWTTAQFADPRSGPIEESPITGCRYRGGWRDLPVHGTSNLTLEPSKTAPSELITALRDGVYLIGCDPAPSLNAAGTLLVKAVGFKIRGGILGKPIEGRLLVPAADLLHRVQEVARDLQMATMGGGVGAPTTLLTAVDVDGSLS